MTRLTWIDFRKELKLLQKLGLHHRWVAIRIADLTKPCTECTQVNDEFHNQPRATCKSCMNIGYSFIDNLVQGYRFELQPGVDFRTPVGIINTQVQVYILQYQAEPKNTDWILELELNANNQPVQPFKVIRSFKIENALPMPGDNNGRIEYWHCNVSEKNFQRP